MNTHPHNHVQRTQEKTLWQFWQF